MCLELGNRMVHMNSERQILLDVGSRMAHANSEGQILLDLGGRMVHASSKRLILLDLGPRLALTNINNRILLALAVNHKCTDPELCKRQIVEDFEKEKPLWILTCYSDCKNVPCDIVGDISYEELWAAAYDDAKRGMSFLSIVEKERNLLSSKLAEFVNLVGRLYVIQPTPLPSLGASAKFSQNTEIVVPPSITSFGQLGAGSAPNVGYGS
ncbi:Zinc finger CCCH domain-containing protein 16 [Quillaja saponaria]|uniref:Zinc finger CCCH domain-containing protein 16 n=1 Tax=Quillaja saponaria TaxID=32244 RepID=A0AAD7LMZ3_QUISA|nr:Zinc finger CCCH domain-containing protein 16 [Quillaja saponaria]